MSSVIRISSNGAWGTTFCVEVGGNARFFTALHVLTECGVPLGATSAHLDMCDDQAQFFCGAVPFKLFDITWDKVCDFVEFSSTFPARPFQLGSRPSVGDAVLTQGYLFLPNGQPDCGVVTALKGQVECIGQLGGCYRARLSVHLQSGEPHVDGMSGGPVADPCTGRVFALLNGARNDDGGPPFIATTLI
jgi:hypothetical protein